MLLILILFSITLYSQTALYCTKSGNDVLLQWEGGTPNYVITYSVTPSFQSGNVSLNSSNPGTTEAHLQALKTNVNYFYDVSGSGETSKAIQCGGYLPPPQPHLLEIYRFDTNTASCTTEVINSGKIGDTICLKVRNINTTDATWNLVDFNGILQKGEGIIDNGDGTYTLMVKIPQGAKSSYIWIISNAIISTESKYLYIIAYNVYNDQTNFRDLSSIVYEDLTNSIWAGDRGDKDKLDEIEENANVIERASRLEPVVGDFVGNYLFYASSYSTSNQGTFTRFDAVNNTTTNWSKCGDTTHNCQVMALTKDSNWDLGYGYVLDNTTHNVKKLQKGLTYPSCVVDFDFGNFGGSLTFNDPGGIRYYNGNIYFTTTGSLYKVQEATEAVELVASGFNGAAGIDITSEGNILLAEEGAGNIWEISSESPYKKTKIYEGLNQPVSVIEGTRSGIRHHFIAEHQRILDYPDGSIKLQPASNINVLISAKHGGGYPEPNFQSQDSKMRVMLNVRPPRQTSVYLKINDPSDKSPYAAGSENDNRCMRKDNATIDPNPVTTDSNGHGEAEIAFYSIYADESCSGDNFYITAHFNPNGPEVARSDIITLWKRVYVERDKMFVKGSALKEAVIEDQNFVVVWDTSPFGVGDKIQIFDIDDQEAPFGEIKIISSIDSINNKLILNGNLTGRYIKTISDNLNNPDSFVGILEDASDPNYYPFYESDLCFIRQAYDPAYVEFVFPEKGSGPVPNPLWESQSCDTINETIRTNFSEKWYKNSGKS
ncbi:MAG: hypothetical protein WHV67_05910, partial [Thermoanaerobaculia bacterium]